MNKNNLINTSRKPWLDALRGLAILMVVYGHCVRDLTNYFVFTSPFKMPLFFAITGYVFVVKEWGPFFTQLFKKVIVPWFFLGLVPVLFFIPFNGFGYFFNYLLSMLSGKVLWFMPCFVIAEIIHYLLRRYVNKDILLVLVALLCTILGLMLSKRGILDYAMFNRALTVQPFFLIGYYFHKYESFFITIRWWVIASAFAIYICMCVISMQLFPGEVIDVHNNRYFNIPFCLVQIILGCLLLFTTASKANFKSKTMSIIGQNTLVIYCWHTYAFLILSVGLSVVGFELQINWFTALVKLLWATVVCSVLALLLNRFLPEVVGKKRN